MTLALLTTTNYQNYLADHYLLVERSLDQKKSFRIQKWGKLQEVLPVALSSVKLGTSIRSSKEVHNFLKSLGLPTNIPSTTYLLLNVQKDYPTIAEYLELAESSDKNKEKYFSHYFKKNREMVNSWQVG